MKILPKNKVEEAVNRLSETMEVYAPVDNGTNTGFFLWTNDPNDELMLDILNTSVPPKNVIVPQAEKLYAFKSQGQEMTVDSAAPAVKDKVIFGARGCDIKAILALDDVFLTRGYVDALYKERRDHVTIVANACYNPGLTCFCQSMGVSPTDPEGADVVMIDLGDKGFGWEARTEKGEKLTAAISNLLADGDYEKPSPGKFVKNVDMDGVPEKLKNMFDSPIWEELAGKCMNCGVCTYLCPSCYCFDIQVKLWGEEGYRFRCWDSCMYQEYTLEAGGGNPRGEKFERFRNRFLHKLEFFKERYGEYLCTGCGRCVVLCPNQVNILEVVKRIKEV